MPEIVASHASRRCAALMEFQRDVDVMRPSHTGKSSGTPDRRHWSDSLSSFLSSSKVEAMAPRPVVVRSQGHFSPQIFIRRVVKRALCSRDESRVSVKRARTQFHNVGYGMEPMILCA